jgi:hypothetical protein
MTGIHEDTISKGFEHRIREVEHRPVVEVALQSFKLDLAGGAAAHPTDVVQVTASLADVGEEEVTVEGPYQLLRRPLLGRSRGADYRRSY